MRTEYEHLLVSVEDGIVDVVLNRPEKRNALTFQMQADLDFILDDAMRNDAVKVVMLRGAGPVFCAGHDLREAAEAYLDTGDFLAADRGRSPSLRRAWYFTKPLIAGVHGFVGPRASMWLGNFDFIIAAEETRFSFEHTRQGARGVGGEPFHLQIPMRVLKKLMMMGGWFDADQALDMHIVQRVVPLDDVAAETRRWAEQLTLIDSESVQVAKMSIHRIYELMGLINMAAVQNKITGHAPTEANQAWWKEMNADGVKAAVSTRDTTFDDGIARV